MKRPPPGPQRDQAWSLMADVGTISEGLAILDTDISRAATRMPAAVQEQLGTSPGVLSDRYASAATHGLRAAGERTRLLAAHGPLPDVAPLRQPLTRPGAVRYPAHVPGAQDATVELLGHVQTISPNRPRPPRPRPRKAQRARRPPHPGPDPRRPRPPARRTTQPNHPTRARDHRDQQRPTTPPTGRGPAHLPARDPPHRPRRRQDCGRDRPQPTCRRRRPPPGRPRPARHRHLPREPDPHERATTALWTRQPAHPDTQPPRRPETG